MNPAKNESLIPGDLLYEYTATLTHVADFGVALDDVLAGKVSTPPSGLRVDITFEGPVRGRLGGHVRGVDYLNIRADGRMELDIKATITTPEGERIALAAGGIGVPRPGSTASRLYENVKLTTAHPRLAWVNPLEIWATGEADVARREVTIRGYLPR